MSRAGNVFTRPRPEAAIGRRVDAMTMICVDNRSVQRVVSTTLSLLATRKPFLRVLFRGPSKSIAAGGMSFISRSAHSSAILRRISL
jgi:hypothetical protein